MLLVPRLKKQCCGQSVTSWFWEHCHRSHSCPVSSMFPLTFNSAEAVVSRATRLWRLGIEKKAHHLSSASTATSKKFLVTKKKIPSQQTKVGCGELLRWPWGEPCTCRGRRSHSEFQYSLTFLVWDRSTQPNIWLFWRQDLLELRNYQINFVTSQIGYQEGGTFTRTESADSLHCHQARQDGIDKKWASSALISSN